MRRRSFVQMLGGLFGTGAATSAGIVKPVLPTVSTSATGWLGSSLMSSEDITGEKVQNEVVDAAKSFAEKVANEIAHLTGRAAKHQVFKATGYFPEWLRREIVESYDEDYHVERRIPPDILCLKSVSFSAKIRMTRQRHIDKEIDAWYDSPSKALKTLMQRQADPSISRNLEYGYTGEMEDADVVKERNKKRLRGSMW